MVCVDLIGRFSPIFDVVDQSRFKFSEERTSSIKSKSCTLVNTSLYRHKIFVHIQRNKQTHLHTSSKNHTEKSKVTHFHILNVPEMIVSNWHSPMKSSGLVGMCLKKSLRPVGMCLRKSFNPIGMRLKRSLSPFVMCH